MNNGERCVRHYTSRRVIRLHWQGGRITDLAAAPGASTDEWWVAPLLFDLQVNGYAGVDFQQDDLTLDHLIAACRQLLAAGCGRFLLTLVTDEWPSLLRRLRRLRSLRAQSPELEHAIAGWHIEGPFLSAEPGFHGAHDPALMQDPTPERICELRSATGNDCLLLTLAPERSGAIAAIEAAVSLGIKVSLGHTNAPADCLQRAVAAGATGFTHLGNGCPQALDRHDNILWRALETPGLTVSLIPDQHHVSPTLFRLLHRVLDPARIYYITDAIAAADAPPGRYTMGRLALDVGTDGIVRQPGQSNYAGSALRPVDGVFRAAHMLGCPWQEAWTRFADGPRQFLGQPWSWALGDRADFCLLKVAGDHRLDQLEVYLAGRLAFKR